MLTPSYVALLYLVYRLVFINIYNCLLNYEITLIVKNYATITDSNTIASSVHCQQYYQ